MNANDVEALRDLSAHAPGGVGAADLRNGATEQPQNIDIGFLSENVSLMLKESQHVLADAADMLLEAEIEAHAREAYVDSPDGDRSAGRLEDTQLDLLSE